MQKVYITATVFDPSSEDTFNGWVDLNWARFELRTEKEDVRPQEYDPESDGTIEKFIESLIGSTEPVSVRGGTYYAEDSVMNPETGELWSYAAHVED